MSANETSDIPPVLDGFWRLVGRILRYGIPSGIQTMLNILSFLIFVFLTGKVGDVAFAVSNAAFTVNYLLIAPIEGFAIGAGVLVGQRQGAGDPQGAFVSGNRALVLAEAYIAVASALILVFRRPILMLFAGDVAASDQTAFLSLGSTLFVMMVVSLMVVMFIIVIVAMMFMLLVMFVMFIMMLVVFVFVIVVIIFFSIMFFQGFYPTSRSIYCFKIKTTCTNYVFDRNFTAGSLNNFNRWLNLVDYSANHFHLLVCY